LTFETRIEKSFSLSGSDSSIYEALVPLAREALRDAVHPTTGRLLAYHCGEVSSEERAEIREHLSLCEECSALVLDAAKFFVDDEPEGSSLHLEAEWQKLRAEMPGAEKFPWWHSLVRSLTFAYCVAAIFATLSAGLVFFKRQNPLRPQINTGIYNLMPSGSERDRDVHVTPIRFSGPSDSALLILNTKAITDSTQIGVRIHRANGTIIWKSEGLVLQDPGCFHLTVSPGALQPGYYSLELYGLAGNKEQALGTFSITVESVVNITTIVKD
jgi:hypothetical protein